MKAMMSDQKCRAFLRKALFLFYSVPLFFTLAVPVVSASSLSYPHLLPSPYTLPAGRLVLGSSAALGVTDFLQIGTDVLSNLYQVYNANAKIGLVQQESFGIAITGGFESYNLQDLSVNNPDTSIVSYLPGAVLGYEMFRGVAHFVGGQYSISKVKLRDSGIEATAFVTGIRAESDFAFVYGDQKKPNAISGGLSYDFAFKLWGFGVGHYWKGLHLGFHYYPKAVRQKIYPIITGGAVVDL